MVNRLNSGAEHSGRCLSVVTVEVDRGKEPVRSLNMEWVHACVSRLTADVSPGGLDSVEYYDIASNEWCAAAPMPWRGLTVKCAAVGDIIYVLAGFQGVGRLGHVLEYHTESDR